MLVDGRQADAGVDDKQDGVGIADGHFGLGAHAPFEAIGIGLLETGGVDDLKAEIAEAGVTDATIARHARRVVDERQLLADEAIEQCRLADVRPSDNGDGRLGCHGWALPSTNDAATGRTPAAALNFQLEPHGMTGAAHELT